MRSDVHSSALRAAAKVAFSVAFVSGCSSAASEPTGSDYEADEPGTAESDITAPAAAGGGAAGAGTSGKKLRPARGCHRDAAAPKPSCESVVTAAFGDGGTWPTDQAPVSKEIASCCEELLVAKGTELPQRWECCSALGWGRDASPGTNLFVACTPWGPPVPPSMKRIRTTPPDAWLALLHEVA